MTDRRPITPTDEARVALLLDRAGFRGGLIVTGSRWSVKVVPTHLHPGLLGQRLNAVTDTLRSAGYVTGTGSHHGSPCVSVTHRVVNIRPGLLVDCVDPLGYSGQGTVVQTQDQPTAATLVRMHAITDRTDQHAVDREVWFMTAHLTPQES